MNRGASSPHTRLHIYLDESLKFQTAIIRNENLKTCLCLKSIKNSLSSNGKLSLDKLK